MPLSQYAPFGHVVQTRRATSVTGTLVLRKNPCWQMHASLDVDAVCVVTSLARHGLQRRPALSSWLNVLRGHLSHTSLAAVGASPGPHALHSRSLVERDPLRNLPDPALTGLSIGHGVQEVRSRDRRVGASFWYGVCFPEGHTTHVRNSFCDGSPKKFTWQGHTMLVDESLPSASF